MGFEVDQPPVTDSANLPDIVAGDDIEYNITFSDENDDPIDISGWEVWMTVKGDYEDSDADADIQVSTTSHDDALNGETSLIFASGDTSGLSGRKVWDLQIKDASDDIRTVVEGEVRFRPEVTQAT